MLLIPPKLCSFLLNVITGYFPFVGAGVVVIVGCSGVVAAACAPGAGI